MTYSSIHLVRVEPEETTQFHLRHQEFIYYISGKGIAEMREAQFEVETDEFMGFPYLTACKISLRWI